MIAHHRDLEPAVTLDIFYRLAHIHCCLTFSVRLTRNLAVSGRRRLQTLTPIETLPPVLRAAMGTDILARWS
ncbi:MAG TPA: hypothetical protein VFU63_04405 [Ktedonobacterales bacterium]|nr:hypothetical protein [Ktedonobacterales bacterium]